MKSQLMGTLDGLGLCVISNSHDMFITLLAAIWNFHYEKFLAGHLLSNFDGCNLSAYTLINFGTFM